MTIPIKESDIQKQILHYLNVSGHFAYRNNSGAFILAEPGKKRRFFRSGKKGSADIIGIQKETGKMIAIEVKKSGAHPSEEQYEFLAEVQSRNGIAFVAFSLDDVINRGL